MSEQQAAESAVTAEERQALAREWYEADQRALYGHVGHWDEDHEERPAYEQAVTRMTPTVERIIAARLAPGGGPMTAESAGIVWKAPPERKPSRVVQVAAQLRTRPGEWALIHHEEGLGFMPWWGPLHELPDFELRFVWEKPGVILGPRDIYARYLGTPPGPRSGGGGR